jgi:putative addiction module component (TIGR02574 family)
MPLGKSDEFDFRVAPRSYRMDFTSILQEISSWPVDDRVWLVQAVWDDMADDAPADPIEDWEAELERRHAELEAHPERAVRWEEIDAHLRRTR